MNTWHEKKMTKHNLDDEEIYPTENVHTCLAGGVLAVGTGFDEKAELNTSFCNDDNDVRAIDNVRKGELGQAVLDFYGISIVNPKYEKDIELFADNIETKYQDFMYNLTDDDSWIIYLSRAEENGFLNIGVIQDTIKFLKHYKI